jgi:hypothetical protein
MKRVRVLEVFVRVNHIVQVSVREVLGTEAYPFLSGEQVVIVVLRELLSDHGVLVMRPYFN